MQEIFDVSGRGILITGASGFFGRTIAKTFLECGSKTILLGRSDKIWEQEKRYQKQFGKDRVRCYQLDFYKRKAFSALLRKLVKRFDIDVLINNAYDFSPRTGFNTPAGRLEESVYEQWRSAFESGIYWAMLATQIIGARFKKKRKGSIINISSMYGIISPSPRLYEGTHFFNPPTYSANKAGLLALTRYTASFWGRYGIRCNAVLPGAFSNVEEKGCNAVAPDDPFILRLRRNTALGRIGHPRDLRGALLYLASDASAYMTGQALVIDGGWTVT
ncbi:MAG: SDR family oxidoreductase [Elusimicrobia bacterium]|nr:SDR family oxidoreductase [Elusimicrobiota bacterium]